MQERVLGIPILGALFTDAVMEDDYATRVLLSTLSTGEMGFRKHSALQRKPAKFFGC
jgi:hypothetical protein